MALPEGFDRPLIEIAQIGYEAYGDEAQWLNYEGKPMPAWDNLPPNIRTRWLKATGEIAKALAQTPSLPAPQEKTTEPPTHILADLRTRFGEVTLGGPAYRHSNFECQTWGTWTFEAVDGSTRGRIVEGTDGSGRDPKDIWTVHREVRCQYCGEWTGELIEEALKRGLCFKHRNETSRS